jgi:hypothetical protein
MESYLLLPVGTSHRITLVRRCQSLSGRGDVSDYQLERILMPMFKLIFTISLAVFWMVPASAQDEIQPEYRATYRVTFEADWSTQTHPASFPSNPHWSGLVGSTHNMNASLWSSGELATPGIQRMAETGSKSVLLNEVDDLITAGLAESAISGSGINPSPGMTSLQFEVSRAFPLVSITSMIAPSPDWFVGVDSLDLRDGDQWRQSVVMDLLPYDSGTDSGSDFQSSNRATNPPEHITQISEAPLDSGVPLGRFRFELLETHGLFPIAGHQSGWYYVPSRSGEGVNFNVAQMGDRLFLSLAWFTYFMGEQLWLFGSVDITPGDEVATVEMYRTSGAGFGDAFSPDDVNLEFWGTITVGHPACGIMDFEWDGPADFGMGYLQMEQLVNVAGLSCH